MKDKPGDGLPLGICVVVEWVDIVEAIHSEEPEQPIYFYTVGLFNGWHKDAKKNYYLSLTNTKRKAYPHESYGTQSYPIGCVVSVDVFPPRD